MSLSTIYFENIRYKRTCSSSKLENNHISPALHPILHMWWLCNELCLKSPWKKTLKIKDTKMSPVLRWNGTHFGRLPWHSKIVCIMSMELINNFMKMPYMKTFGQLIPRPSALWPMKWQHTHSRMTFRIPLISLVDVQLLAKKIPEVKRQLQPMQRGWKWHCSTALVSNTGRNGEKETPGWKSARQYL